MWRYALLAIFGLFLIGGSLWLATAEVRGRYAFFSTVFSGEEQYERLNRLEEVFDSVEMSPSPEPFVFPAGAAMALPDRYFWRGESRAVDSFLRETDTVALLVLENGKIRYENYWLSGGPDVNWLSMSVAKSFVSALVGIAVAEGSIASIDDPVTDYVPELLGSSYDAVPIRDILQMSSGTRWNEDYSDPESDIMRQGRVLVLGGSMDDFVTTLRREREPGTVLHYNSMDTQALGMLLVRATGRSIADYMQDKLWHPLGAEYRAYWVQDSEGMELAFMGLNATARDYAKLGELYRLRGNWQGKQLVPEDWVVASTSATAPHLLPGREGPESWGYGLQWWLPPGGDDGEFSAIGVYNQFIYVDTTLGLVVVKLSASSDYGSSNDESSYRELESIALFRAIGAAL